jgi:hypothetical protein
MGAIRKVLLVGVGVLALHGASACTSDTELNPQPLPPDHGGGEGVRARTPAESESGVPKAPGSGGTAGGTSSGTDGTTSGGTNPLPPDAGAGDAGGRD